MKNSFATFVAVLVTLCTTSTALADTPTPSGNVSVIAFPIGAQFNYSIDNPQAPKILPPVGGEIATVEGFNVKISISYTGMPEPSLVVYKNGQKIVSGDLYYISQEKGVCTLIIKDAYPEDSGVYTFKFTNIAGVTEASYLVTITRK